MSRRKSAGAGTTPAKEAPDERVEIRGVEVFRVRYMTTSAEISEFRTCVRTINACGMIAAVETQGDDTILYAVHPREVSRAEAHIVEEATA